MQRIVFVALSIALAVTNVFPLGAIPQFPIVSAPLQQEATLTPSPTEPASTETPTPEIFPTATEEATESPTPTLEVTEIPSPTPEATVVVDGTPADLPEALMELKASPRFLRPGGKVNLHWYLDIDPLADGGGYTLRLQLPANVVPEEGEPFIVNADGMLESSVALDKANGKVKLAVLDQAVTGETAAILVQLLKDGTLLAEQELSLVVAQRVSKANGGEVSGAKDQRAKVIFPPNALPEDADVVVMDLGWEDDDLTSSSSGKPWHPFKIEAYRANGEEITHFDQEITIEYAYDPEEYAGNESVLYLSYFDEETQEWVALPGEVDMDGKRIIARSDHLTVLNPNYAEWQAAMLPGMAGWQVSTFTGAATYSVPLTLPPGPGGLQPSLELGYNSQVIDNASTTTQASWVGMGWSLDVPYIQRDDHGTWDDLSDDLFYIYMNGVSGLMVKTSDGYWHTEDVNFARIELHGDQTTDESWWEVWLKDGTRYWFGKRVGDDKSIADRPYCKSSSVSSKMPWRWAVSHVISVYDDQANPNHAIRYKYTLHEDWRESTACETNPTATFWIYPKEIIYPNQAYRIVFNRGERKDIRYMWRTDISRSGRTAFMAWRLNSIDIEHDPNSDGNFTDAEKIRQYQFTYANDQVTGIENTIIWPGYEWDNGYPSSSQNKTLTLIRFQELVWGENNQWNALPPSTFNYGTGVTADGVNYPEGDAQHLRWVENSYGGRIEFTYSPWACNVTNDDGSQDGADCTYAWDSLDQNDPWKRKYGNFNDVIGDLGPSVGEYIYWYSWDEKNLAHPGAAYQLHMKAERWYGSGTVPLRVTVSNGAGGQRIALESTVTKSAPAVEYHVPYFLDGNAILAYAAVDTDCGTAENGGCHIFQFQHRYLPTFYRVTAMTTIDQQSGMARTTSYSYQGGKMNPKGSLDKINMLRPPLTEFRGFETVVETAPDGHKTTYTYWQDNYLQGRLKEVKITGADTQQVFQRTAYSYEVLSGDQLPFTNTTYYWWAADILLYWARLSAEETYSSEGDDSSFVGRKTTYAYEPNTQGGAQWGNLTHQSEFEWKNNAWQPVRSQRTYYYPNVSSSLYLTGLPAFTQTFTCSTTPCEYSGATLQGETMYLYDGHTSYFAPPTRGIVTYQRTRIGLDAYSDVSFTYDAWGNRITSTSYTVNGTLNTPATQGAQTTTFCYGGGLATDPDCPYDGHATYLLWTENSIGRVSSTYDYRTGNVLTETNLNGRATEAEYDSLGRLMNIYLPKGATEFLALSVEYHLPTGPSDYFWTKATQFVDSTTSRSIYKLYNGLGQLVQTQMPTSEVEGLCSTPGSCTLVTDYYEGYESYSGVLYRVSKTSLSRAVPNLTGGSYSVPDSSTLWSSAYSDALGRPVTQIAAGGLVTHNTYAIEALTIGGITANYQLATTIEDAEDPTKNVITKNYSDAFGRLISVVPAEGNRIVYAYDSMDRLVNVDQVRSDTLATFATTKLTYDWAGRKTKMEDPAMGVWEYTYDAAGNLVFQQNEDNKNTCLYYDGANRLIGKNYFTTIPDPLCPATSQYSVSYSYDAGTDGKGQRTGMVDASGATTWTYNELGLVTSEERVINQLPAGSNTFTLSYKYDDSGAMTAVIYPDGEKVTTAYYPNGQAKGLTSTLGDTFIANVQYDALGRRTNVNYGNGLTAAYTYFAWNAERTENSGKLQQVSLSKLSQPSLFTQSFTNYDQAGNILSMTVTSPNTGAQTVTYTYDQLYRLLTASASGGAIPGYELGYTFDPTGRIQSVTQSGVTSNYLYDDSQGHSTAVTGFGSNTYAYDPLGNMETRTENGITYIQEWTPENKLKKVTWSDDNRQYTTTFVYDGDGNRVLQIERTIEPDLQIKEITTLYIGGVFEKQYVTVNLTGYFDTLASLTTNSDTKPSSSGVRLASPPAVIDSNTVPAMPSNEGNRRLVPGTPELSVNQSQLEAPQAVVTYTNWTLGKTWPYAGKVILLVTNAHMAGSDGDGKDAKWPVINGGVQNFLPVNNGVASSYYELWYDLPANTQFTFTTGMWYNFDDQYLDNNRSNAGTFTTTSFNCGPHGRADVMQQRSTAIKNAHIRGEEVKHFCFDAYWPWPTEGGGGNGDYDDMMLIALWFPNDEVQPTLGFSGATSNVWYNVNKTITPASSDASGIAVQYVSTYNGGWVSSFTATQSTDVYCYAKDTYGNEKSGKCGTVLIDKGVPILPNVEIDLANSSNCATWQNGYWQNTCYDPAFKWSGASDALSGVSGYNVYWGIFPTGTSTAFQTTTTYNPPSISSGTYYFRLRVKDVAGNYSAWTTLFTLKYDNTPPDDMKAIRETHGVQDGVWQNAISDPAFVWDASNDDVSGLFGYEIQWDATTFNSVASYDPPGLAASGESILLVRAKDNAGNYSNEITFVFRYDGTPPANPSGAVETNGVVNNTWTNQNNPSFTWSGAYATSGIAGYNVYWGLDAFGTQASAFVAGEVYTPEPITTVADGTYYLRVQTKDNAGNFAATYATLFVYRFDSSSPAIGSPTISIEEGSANLVFEAENRTLFYSAQSSGAVSIGATITDYYSGADRMEFPAMFGEAAATVTGTPYYKRYPITGSESSVGAFRLTGFDQAGNSAQSAAVVFVKDLTGPTMTTAEAPSTAGLMIPVRWAGADEFGGAGLRSYNVEVREGTGEWSRWLTETTQTQADFGVEDGKQYTFRVQGVDRVGNAGAWLETATATTYAVTKYYAMAGQRVAMRQGSTVSYLYGDHLGSTSLITDAAGAAVTETRYQPYGRPYWQWGATRTDFGFTGQRLDGFGLMDYNARYYSSTLGRFISPDTIIPQPGSPMAWDRYSYVYSNPVNGIDPSGHKACEWDGDGNCVRDPDWEPGEDKEFISSKSDTPISDFITNIIPGTSKDWSIASSALDGIAEITDLYAVGIVIYGGIFGAGLPAPLILVGLPEVPVVTGIAGIALAELAAQPVIRLGNIIATLSTGATVISDTKAGTTLIEQGVFSPTSLNSITLTTLGWTTPSEAFLSLAIQTTAVLNDFGIISVPFPQEKK